MLRWFTVVGLIGLSTATVAAAPVTLTLNNLSDESITAVTADLKGTRSEAPTNLLSGQIAAGQSGAITLEAAENACLYEVTLSFASGRTVVRPDLDVCQTEGLDVD